MKLSTTQMAGLAAVVALASIAAFAIYSARTGAPEGSASAPEAAGDRTAATPAERPAEGSSGEKGLVTSTIEQVMLSPKARILAERFKCVCGCDDILATCTCDETPGSIDMKKYLQQLVDEGKSPAEVESAMVARYGEAVRP